MKTKRNIWAVLAESQSQGNARLVLLLLGFAADLNADAGQPAIAAPGIDALSEWARIPEGEVATALAELEDAGELQAVGQGYRITSAPFIERGTLTGGDQESSRFFTTPQGPARIGSAA
jgi:hypothetical protein